MASRFVAMLVKKGDAFLLERGERIVLVDGGEDINFVSGVLNKNWHKSQKIINIVVCTHNDKDHSQGIIQLLSSPQYKVREVRLPAIWDVINDSLGKEVEFEKKFSYLEELILDVSYLIEARLTAVDDFQRLVNKILRGQYRKEDNYEVWVNQHRQEKRAIASGFVEALVSDEREAAAEGVLEETNEFRAKEAALMSFLSYIKASLTTKEFFRNILRYINRILAVMILIEERKKRGEKIQIRFYRYRYGRPIDSSDDEVLLPVNAAEVTTWKFRKTKGKPSSLNNPAGHIALSITNRNSLSFYAKEDQTSPGVIFTAECRVNPIGCQPTRLIIATAPHHGSKDNANVYQNVLHWAQGGSVWVRSDYKNGSRPCPQYVKLKEKKYCTVCNTMKNTGQTVELYDSMGNWQTNKMLKVCNCQ